MTTEKTTKKPAAPAKAAATAKAPAAKGQKRTITLRLHRGRIGATPDQRASLMGLGLKTRHQERTLENTPAVRGMIKKVLHMVDIVSETR